MKTNLGAYMSILACIWAIIWASIVVGNQWETDSLWDLGVEVCDDGKDNDGNLYIDCEDFWCFRDPVCNEVCTDGKDNNNNGKIDCLDFNCLEAEQCREVCTDSIDNNGDLEVDCFDLRCAMTEPACWLLDYRHPFELCDDKIDNNKDGMTDCEDKSCSTSDYCTKEEQLIWESETVREQTIIDEQGVTKTEKEEALTELDPKAEEDLLDEIIWALWWINIPDPDTKDDTESKDERLLDTEGETIEAKDEAYEKDREDTNEREENEKAENYSESIEEIFHNSADIQQDEDAQNKLLSKLLEELITPEEELKNIQDTESIEEENREKSEEINPPKDQPKIERINELQDEIVVVTEKEKSKSEKTENVVAQNNNKQWIVNQIKTNTRQEFLAPQEEKKWNTNDNTSIDTWRKSIKDVIAARNKRAHDIADEQALQRIQRVYTATSSDQALHSAAWNMIWWLPWSLPNTWTEQEST